MVILWIECKIFCEPCGLHIHTPETYNDIGYNSQAQGHYSKALEYYRKVLKIQEKVLGNNHPYTIDTYKAIERIKNEK